MFQASDLFAMQEAARAGSGAAALPRFMGDGDPGLIRLPTAAPPPSRDIWLATYPDLKRSPSIRLVMDFIGAVVAHHCPLRGD
jgi:DNA-binding transcriptional LysR family regulator